MAEPRTSIYDELNYSNITVLFDTVQATNLVEI